MLSKWTPVGTALNGEDRLEPIGRTQNPRTLGGSVNAALILIVLLLTTCNIMLIYYIYYWKKIKQPPKIKKQFLKNKTSFSFPSAATALSRNNFHFFGCFRFTIIHSQLHDTAQPQNTTDQVRVSLVARSFTPHSSPWFNSVQGSVDGWLAGHLDIDRSGSWRKNAIRYTWHTLLPDCIVAHEYVCLAGHSQEYLHMCGCLYVGSPSKCVSARRGSDRINGFISNLCT